MLRSSFSQLIIGQHVERELVLLRICLIQLQADVGDLLHILLLFERDST